MNKRTRLLAMSMEQSNDVHSDTSYFIKNMLFIVNKLLSKT